MINAKYLEKIAKDLLDNNTENTDNIDPTRMTLGALGAVAGAGVGTGLNALAYKAAITDLNDSSSGYDALHETENMLANAGYKLDGSPYNPYYKNNTGHIISLRTNLGTNESPYAAPTHIDAFGSVHGNPSIDVHINKGNPKSTIAHELGHAISLNKGTTLHSPKNITLGRYLGEAAPYAGASVLISTPGITSDRDLEKSIDRGIVGISTLASLPMLGQELEASYRGAKLMKGDSLWRKAGAFKGVPSYLTMAAFPYLTYKGKQLALEKYDKDKEDY